MSEKRYRERKKSKLDFYEYEEKKKKERQSGRRQPRQTAGFYRALDMGYDKLTNSDRRLEAVERCPYCDSRVELIHESELFDKPSGKNEMYFACVNKKCNTYCRTVVENGVHFPMGKMANQPLRALRTETHRLMDQLLTLGVFKERREMYGYFAAFFGIRMEEMHISMFDTFNCQKVIEQTVHLMEINKDKCSGKVELYEREIPTYVDKHPELKERLVKLSKKNNMS